MISTNSDFDNLEDASDAPGPIIEAPQKLKPMAQVHLKVGDRAPAFTLKCTDGRLISLADYAGQKQVVLFYYSKDTMPECGAEARLFRDHVDRIRSLNAEIIAVSVDDIYSHRTFVRENKLNYLVLADTTKTVSAAYGILKKEGYCSRATFIVDKHGLLKSIFMSVPKFETHIEDIVKSLKGQSNLSASPPKNS
jgi:peroxiredoxin Q/BCP